LALALLAPLPAVAADTVTDQVFGRNLMQGVSAPVRLHYRFAVQGEGGQPPVEGPLVMEVRGIKAEGDKEVFVDMLDGPNQRHLGPMSAREQNPLVLLLLQRDVAEMANLTGGAAGYFQQQIRRAFNGPAEVGGIEIELVGRKVQASRVVMRPFTADPRIDRFPQFKDKAYEFVVSDAVPGGLYRFASRTPDVKDGHLILEESVTYERAAP
jgi:hypothetical protein